MNRRFATLAAASLLAVSACTQAATTPQPSSGAAAKPAVVTIGQAADPPTLDPQKPGGPIGDNFNQNLFDPLTTQDDTGKVIPNLATEWTALSSSKWRFKLRQDVKFSDGEAVDATAVKFTVSRVLEPGKVRNTYSFGTIASVDVVDPFTVDITTKVPSPFLPLQVTDLYILPPKATVDAGEDGFGQKPVGSGPYALGEWVPNQRIVLNANKTYWKGAPKIDQQVLRPIPDASTRLAELLNGGIDIMSDVTPEQAVTIKGNNAVGVSAVKSKRVPFVGMNLLAQGNAALKDKRVRQALNYAVDVDAIIKSVLGGNGTRLATYYRPDWPGFDQSVTAYQHDLAKAKALLAEAGFANGLSLRMQTSDAIINKGLEVAQAVVGQLAEAGIKVDLTAMDLATIRATVIGGQAQGKTADLYLWNWGAKLGDPTSAPAGFLASTGISSYWKNQAFDELLTKTVTAGDENQRNAGFRQIQSIVKDEAPIIFLYQAADIWGISNRVKWTPRSDQYIRGIEMQLK